MTCCRQDRQGCSSLARDLSVVPTAFLRGGIPTFPDIYEGRLNSDDQHVLHLVSCFRTVSLSVVIEAQVRTGNGANGLTFACHAPRTCRGQVDKKHPSAVTLIRSTGKKTGQTEQNRSSCERAPTDGLLVSHLVSFTALIIVSLVQYPQLKTSV